MAEDRYANPLSPTDRSPDGNRKISPPSQAQEVGEGGQGFQEISKQFGQARKILVDAGEHLKKMGQDTGSLEGLIDALDQVYNSIPRDIDQQKAEQEARKEYDQFLKLFKEIKIILENIVKQLSESAGVRSEQEAIYFTEDLTRLSDWIIKTEGSKNSPAFKIQIKEILRECQSEWKYLRDGISSMFDRYDILRERSELSFPKLFQTIDGQLQQILKILGIQEISSEVGTRTDEEHFLAVGSKRDPNYGRYGVIETKRRGFQDAKTGAVLRKAMVVIAE